MPRRAARVAGLLAVACLAVAGRSAATASLWTQAGPLGGQMAALAQSPSSPQVLYAATQLGPVFATHDGGATWSPRRGGPLGDPFADLMVDSQDPQTVYAVTGGFGLLRTRDGGLSWSAIGAGLPSVLALAQDRQDPDTLYAATFSGLYRSPDAGESWGAAAFAGAVVATIAIDPHDSATLFATLPGHSPGDLTTLSRSTDGGRTWAATSLSVQTQGFADGRVHLVFDPARPGTLYAFFIGDFQAGPTFRSGDGGVSWSPLPAAAGIHDLAATPSGTLFAAADLGIARSSDGGDSWQPPLPASGSEAAAPRDAIVRFAPAASAPGTLVAAGSEGIWKSGDGGATWGESNQGIVTMGVFSLAAAPAGPETVIAIAGDSVFRSSDQGSTWMRAHSNFDGPQPESIVAFDPHNPRTIYGFGSDGQADFLAKSTHRGRDWTRLPVPYACGGDSICSVSMDAFAIDPRQTGTVYVAGSYFFHFGGSGSFFLRSNDDFQSWKALALPRGLNLLALAIAPGNGSLLYGLTCGGLFQSEDGATSWRREGRGLPDPLCAGEASRPPLVLDPERPSRLFVGATGRGIWSSSNGGGTFQPMNRGLETATVVSLVVDPTSSSRLYAGVAGQGVFRWAAQLQRWLPLNEGLPVKDLTGILAIDPQHPSVLFAGTATQGAFRLDL